MELLEKVFQKIDEQWEEEVAFLQKLGKFPSTLGNEEPIQRYLAKAFRDMGLETNSFVTDHKKLASHPAYSPVEWSYDGRPNVVATWPTKGPKIGKSLILQGHVDVVSPEPMSFWEYDPWGSTIEGDKMYGRGICDMKAGITAMVYAVKAIKEAGIELGADVLLETVIEEECTGNGALATLIEGYVADGGLIPEPTGLRGHSGQVGVIWMRAIVRGAGAHVRSADKAVSAIEKAGFVVKALQEYRKKINEAPKHPFFEDVEHPLNVNIGVIESGDWASTVASECKLEARIGFYPDQDPEDIKEEVRQFILECTSQDEWLKNNPPEINFFAFHAHGVVLDPKMELFQYLEKAHEKVNSTTLAYRKSTATTDIKYYNLNYNIPTTCYGPSGANVHAPNEWVDIPSVKACTKTYAAFILDWCGVRE